jgi:hypothetical protein
MFQLTFSSDSCGFFVYSGPLVVGTGKSPSDSFKVTAYSGDDPLCRFATFPAMDLKALSISIRFGYMTVCTTVFKQPFTHGLESCRYR